MYKFIRYWVPVISYAAFIFYLSSIPGENIPFLFSYQDVITHIVEYAILAFLINRCLKAYFPLMMNVRRLVWVFFLSVIYATTDEFHQIFVPNRDPSYLDVIYDSFGAVLANFLSR